MFHLERSKSRVGRREFLAREYPRSFYFSNGIESSSEIAFITSGYDRVGQS
jgi:hypothetical protein